MPAYFQKYQQPITPPTDYGFQQACGGAQYLQPTYNQYGAPRAREDSVYGYADRYEQPRLPSVSSTMMYPQHNAVSYQSAVLPAPYPTFEPLGAQGLPTMQQLHQQRSMIDMNMRQRSQEFGVVAQPPKEEKPSGGVSAKLDYEMEMMTEFVCEMAHNIVQTGRPMPGDFKKWAHAVLTATRLPAATIVLGLQYLSLRMAQLSHQRPATYDQATLQKFLTLGLLLGSKFLDDNTFINKSWSEVSGINVLTLNVMESEWLAAFDFRLHRDPSESQGFQSWMAHWKDYEGRKQRQTKLSPIDTAVYPYAAPKTFSSASYSNNGWNRQLPTPEYSFKSAQPHFTTPVYSQYDAWSARPSMDYSPASSAPITGPTTPEHYANSSTWSAPEPYNRRSMFGLAPVNQSSAGSVVTQAQQSTLNYSATPFTPAQSVNPWNGHPISCVCAQCPRAYTAQAVY